MSAAIDESAAIDLEIKLDTKLRLRILSINYYILYATRYL
jgi:hypothetical protein